MENNQTPNIRTVSRKQTLKRHPNNLGMENNERQLKMLLLFGLIKIFNKNKQIIFQNYEQQKEKKLKQTGMHFNRTSSTISIEPIKKQIINLNHTAKLLDPMVDIIILYFSNVYKKPTVRKSVNYSSSFINSTLNFDSIKLTQTVKFDNNDISKSIDSPKQSVFFQELRQNVNHNKSITKITHRRYRSDFQFLRASRNSSPIREVSNGKKKQKIFISKKKQQIKFLRKMTVQFTTQQSQFKALMQIMQVFVKNYNRASYYLKMIDQNINKCQNIHVYINQLIKLFNSINQIFVQISKLNKALTIKQDNLKNFRVQFKQLPPEIQEYYEKSNEMIKIIRHFSLSQIFPSIMKSQKQTCTKLVSYFVQARYILKYLQKQIQISESSTKQNIKLPKWQKAFRVKFLPKNNLC